MAVSNIVIDLSDNSYDKYYTENLENSIYDLGVTCGTVDIQASPGAPQAPIGCGATKNSGESINLAAAPNGAIGPYHVRFFRMPASGGSMSFGEIGSVRNVSEGSSTSTSFTLYDTDLVAASGKTNAGTPEFSTVTLGNIIDPLDITAPLATGKIRVATTIYDSCPTGGQSCISYCDVTLGCVAPTCNFTVI